MDSDDLDWAVGELLHLFARAGRYGVYPHELDPALFQRAWRVLNSQPFEVRRQCYAWLMKDFKPPLPRAAGHAPVKRYAYAVPH